MADCIFCAIVAGDAGADVVLDEPGFMAFLDRRPVFISAELAKAVALLAGGILLLAG